MLLKKRARDKKKHRKIEEIRPFLSTNMRSSEQTVCTFVRQAYRISVFAQTNQTNEGITKSKKINPFQETPSLKLRFHLLKDLWLFIGLFSLHATLQPKSGSSVVQMKLLVQIIVHTACKANDGFKLVNDTFICISRHWVSNQWWLLRYTTKPLCTVKIKVG